MMRSICNLATPGKTVGQTLGVLEMVRGQADPETVVKVLGPADTALLRRLAALIWRERNEHDAFETPAPERFEPAAWLRQGHHLALAAVHEGDLVGGLAASHFHPLGHERGELHVTQLAVRAGPWRQEIAALLIRTLGQVARERRLARILLQVNLLEFHAIASILPPVERKDLMQFEIPVLQQSS